MKQKELLPKRRFEGFNDEWEERNLEEVIEGLYNGQTPSRFKEQFWGGDINWLSSGELNKGVVTDTIEKITEEGRKAAHLKVVPRNTFIMAITGLEATGTRGNCAITEIDTTLNQSCMAVYPNQSLLDTQFLFQWYRNIGEVYGLKYTQGTKQQSYNAGLVNKLKINLPSKNEQQKIGQFFQHLDDMIALQQRKINKSKALKAAYLAEMFPAEGESVPKRRFEGFTEEWKEKKLGDLVESFGYGLNASAIDYDGKNKYLRITDIDDDTRMFNENGLTSPNTDLMVAENYLLQENDILFARTGASVGKTYRYQEYDGKVYYAGFLIRGRIKANFSSEFIFQNTFTTKYESFIKITSQRSGQPGVNAREYAEYQLMLPSKEEQAKVGELFKQLDATITTHQQKLNKLKATKQAYLHEMFV